MAKPEVHVTSTFQIILTSSWSSKWVLSRMMVKFPLSQRTYLEKEITAPWYSLHGQTANLGTDKDEKVLPLMRSKSWL
jgi:hypothetical protein